MTTIQVQARAWVQAPAENVYRILADYRRHHRRILPPGYSDVVVEEGGMGAGTVVSFDLTAGRRTRAHRMRVAEPEPGRVLTESDENSDLVTTFTVTPEGASSVVHIESRWPRSRGLRGLAEQVFTPPAIRRLHRDLLTLLGEHTRRMAG